VGDRVPTAMTVEVESHRYEYRDRQGNIVAEWDENGASGRSNEVLAALVEDGEDYLRLHVDGVRALGTYGDIG
jgi:hypothetical protein